MAKKPSDMRFAETMTPGSRGRPSIVIGRSMPPPEIGVIFDTLAACTPGNGADAIQDVAVVLRQPFTRVADPGRIEREQDDLPGLEARMESANIAKRRR